MAIRFFDMFAGIGGFRSGLESVGGLFTARIVDKNGNVRIGKVRRLMPIECWRIQDFTNEQFHKAQSIGLSDRRLYKMAGNAVSVPVIAALGQKLKNFHERTFGRTECGNETIADAACSEVKTSGGGDQGEDSCELGGE